MGTAITYMIVALTMMPYGAPHNYSSHTSFTELAACFRAATIINRLWRDADIVGVATCRPVP